MSSPIKKQFQNEIEARPKSVEVQKPVEKPAEKSVDKK